MLLLLTLACDDPGLKLEDSSKVRDSTAVIDDTAPTDDSLDPTDSGSTDSGSTDSGSADSGTTDSTDDSGTIGPIEATLGFELDGERTGVSVGLTPLLPGPGGELAFGDGWIGIEASAARVELDVPAADNAWLLDLGGGLRAAILAPAAHLDTNGDGVHQSDEQVVGIGEDWAIYLVGNVPAPMSARGFVEGWNGMGGLGQIESVLDASYVDPSSIPLPINLRPVESVTLAGTYTGERAIHLAIMPIVALKGGPLSSVLYDEPVTGGSFSVELDGAPPADHFEPLTEIDAPEASYATEVPISYLDADGSGGISDGDAALYAACLDGLAVVSTWIEPPADLYYAWYLSIAGYATGWNVYATSVDGEARWLSSAEAESLVLDDSCSLE